MFADDLAVRIGKDRTVSNIKLVDANGSVDDWCFHNQLCLNASKTENLENKQSIFNFA